MTPFNTHTGKTAILDRGNIDTDQIISKEHLKSIKRTGFGPALFSDWRYLKDGSENPDFALNNPDFKGATILITGNNFGCGSSREHAVWSIMQYGFRVVIAPVLKSDGGPMPGFADIFRNNSLKNGLLLIELNETDTTDLKAAVLKSPQSPAVIDLKNQTVRLNSLVISFEIDPGVKERLLNGLDDIGITLRHEKGIVRFEAGHDVQM